MARRFSFERFSLLVAGIFCPAVASAQAPPYLMQWGTYGTGAGQFDSPYDVAVDAGSDVYVVEWGNNRIQKFTNSGAYLTQWGAQGSGPGQFGYPVGVAVDGSGDVYVTISPTVVFRSSPAVGRTSWSGVSSVPAPASSTDRGT